MKYVVSLLILYLTITQVSAQEKEASFTYYLSEKNKTISRDINSSQYVEFKIVFKGKIENNTILKLAIDKNNSDNNDGDLLIWNDIIQLDTSILKMDADSYEIAKKDNGKLFSLIKFSVVELSSHFTLGGELRGWFGERSRPVYSVYLAKAFNIKKLGDILFGN